MIYILYLLLLLWLKAPAWLYVALVLVYIREIYLIWDVPGCMSRMYERNKYGRL
jgi:hypothetical protein